MPTKAGGPSRRRRPRHPATANPDLKAIYMHAGGVFLAPTLQTLKRNELLHPAGESTSSSSPTTASRRSSTRSATARPTPPCRSRPTSTPSTG